MIAWISPVRSLGSFLPPALRAEGAKDLRRYVLPSRASGGPEDVVRRPDGDALQSRLGELLNDHGGRGVVGASLAMARPGRVMVTATAGYADRETARRLTPGHLFRTASTKKTFTAAAVLALVAEGRVSLDRTIEGWFPTLPRAAEIRVRHLLNHRSGLPEYEAFMPKRAADDWTPRRIVDFALAGAEQRAPGREFAYSNTGYVLVGEIVARERGETLSSWLRREVFEPAGMRDTWSGGDERFPRERLARAYFFDSANPDAPPEESSDWFPLSGIGAAGDLVTTPRDLATGFRALFTGRVLDRAGLDLLAAPLLPASYPGTRVTHCGHGALVSHFGGLAIVGHLGQLRGHVTMAGHHEGSGITVALCQNSASSDLEAFGSAGIHDAFAAAFRLAGA